MSTSGIGGPALVDEALEEEPMADGVDARDAQHVGDDRVARAAPTLGRDLRSRAKRMRSQQMRKNSARPVRSMTSSSCASCLTTAGVMGW